MELFLETLDADLAPAVATETPGWPFILPEDL